LPSAAHLRRGPLSRATAQLHNRTLALVPEISSQRPFASGRASNRAYGARSLGLFYNASIAGTCRRINWRRPCASTTATRSRDTPDCDRAGRQGLCDQQRNAVRV